MAPANIMKRGSKRELEGDPDDADDLTEDLQLNLDTLEKLWATPCIVRDTSAAVWRPALRAAEVICQRGNLLQRMGFIYRSKLHLQVEEAVYLFDRASLLLLVEDGEAGMRLLSLQEAYRLLMSTGVTLDQYLVYSHLRRAGTVACRHPALWVLAPELDPAELWAGWPWGGADRTAAGARADGRVREEAAARAASRRRPPAARLDAPDLPPERALHERAHAGGEPQLAPAGAGREARWRGWWPPAHGSSAAGSRGGSSADGLDGLPRCGVLTAEDARDASLPARAPRLRPFPALARPADMQAAPAVFDIMRPDASMSRRAPPPAALRLFLSAGRPPGWAEAGAADASAGGAPAVYASRSQGAYAFYLLRRVTLASLW